MNKLCYDSSQLNKQSCDVFQEGFEAIAAAFVGRRCGRNMKTLFKPENKEHCKNGLPVKSLHLAKTVPAVGKVTLTPLLDNLRTEL